MPKPKKPTKPEDQEFDACAIVQGEDYHIFFHKNLPGSLGQSRKEFAEDVRDVVAEEVLRENAQAIQACSRRTSVGYTKAYGRGWDSIFGEEEEDDQPN